MISKSVRGWPLRAGRLIGGPLKYFEFDHVKEVRVVGLFDFELIVDAHQDGDASSIVATGENARAIAVLNDEDVVTVHGPNDGLPRDDRPLEMSGTFITGNFPIPLIPVPRQPLRIRYGGTGEAPVRIELSLPPGQRVTLRGPFHTVTTAAPRERAGEPHEELVSEVTRRRARAMMARAREARLTGSLAGAVRAHALEQEAQRILDRDR